MFSAVRFPSYRVWNTGVAFSDALVLWKGHILCYLAIISIIYRNLSLKMLQTFIIDIHVGLKPNTTVVQFNNLLLLETLTPSPGTNSLFTVTAKAHNLSLKCKRDGRTLWTWNQLACDQSIHTYTGTHSRLSKTLSFPFFLSFGLFSSL